MPTVTKSITVRATPEKTFQFVARPQANTLYVPSLSRIYDMKGDPNTPGTTWSWDYTMAGVPFSGVSELTAYEPNRRWGFKTTGPVPSDWRYTITPDGDGSRVEVTIEYTVPDSLLGRMADRAVVERTNEREAEQGLENLKKLIEGEF
jgi:hypothetical protein